MATTFASARPRTLAEPEGPAFTSGVSPLRRFTLDGSDSLERLLADSCRIVKDALLASLPRGSIEGLLLGGGYGRGEGGVLRGPEGDRPYNDLEFYLFVRGNRHIFEHRWRGVLNALAHDLSPAAGLEIEFKVLTLAELRRAPVSMFFYDMLAGHKWLIGDDGLLEGCEHHCAAHLLPLSEATRLLMNRCSGLLFARQKIAADPFDARDADFIRRNIAKAQLALGDAILAVFGRYHWSCRERHERLLKFSGLRGPSATIPIPPGIGTLIAQHRLGLRFKLHPFQSRESLLELAPDLDAIIALAREVWLWLESKRLHHSFMTPRHYATSPLRKWPESRPARNLLHNLKLFRRPVFHEPCRHPREHILESLAVLLWEPSALTDSTLRSLLRRNLRHRINDRPAAIDRYRQIWAQVS